MRGPQHGGSGRSRAGAGVGNIFYHTGLRERDSPESCQEHGRPHRFRLVVGAASGGSHVRLEGVARDSTSFAVSTDGPRGFRLVVRAAIAKFSIHTGRRTRDSAAFRPRHGRPRRFRLVVGAASGDFSWESRVFSPCGFFSATRIDGPRLVRCVWRETIVFFQRITGRRVRDSTATC